MKATQEVRRVSDSSPAAGSVCLNCKFWEGIEELGSYIEGTCFAMMRLTGYAETCDEFTPNGSWVTGGAKDDA